MINTENTQIGIILQYLQNNNYNQTIKDFTLELRNRGIQFDADSFIQEASGKLLNSQVFEPNTSLLQTLLRQNDQQQMLNGQISEQSRMLSQNSAEIIKLRRQNQELQNNAANTDLYQKQINVLQQQLDEYQIKTQTLQSERDQFEKHLAVTQLSTQQLQTQLNSNLEDAIQQAERYQQEYLKAQKQIQKLNTDLEYSKKEKQQLQQQQLQIRNEQQASMVVMNDIREKEQFYIQQIKSQETQIQSLNQQVSMNELTKNTSQKQLSDLQSSIQTKQLQLMEKETQYNSLLNSYNDLKQETSQKLQSIQAEVQTIRQELIYSEETNQRIMKENIESKQQLEDQLLTVQDLQKQLEFKQTEKDSLMQQIDQKQLQITQSNNQVIALSEELQKAKGEINDLKMTAADQKVHFDALQFQLKSAQQNIKQQEEAINNCNEDNKQVKEKFLQLDAAIQSFNLKYPEYKIKFNYESIQAMDLTLIEIFGNTILFINQMSQRCIKAIQQVQRYQKDLDIIIQERKQAQDEVNKLKESVLEITQKNAELIASQEKQLKELNDAKYQLEFVNELVKNYVSRHEKSLQKYIIENGIDDMGRAQHKGSINKKDVSVSLFNSNGLSSDSEGIELFRKEDSSTESQKQHLQHLIDKGFDRYNKVLKILQKQLKLQQKTHLQVAQTQTDVQMNFFDNINAKYEEYQKQIDNTNAKIKEMHQNDQKNAKEIKELQDQIAQKAFEMIGFQNQLQAQNDKEKHYEAQIKLLQEQCQNQKMDEQIIIQQKDAVLKNYQERINKLDVELQQMQHKSSESDQSYNQLKMKLDQTNTEKQIILDEIQRFFQQKGIVYNQTNMQNGQLSNVMHSAIQQLIQESSKFSTLAEDTTQQYQKCLQEYKALEEQHNQIKAQLSAQQSTITRQNMQLQESKLGIDSFNSQLSNYRAQINQLQRENDELEENINELNTKLRKQRIEYETKLQKTNLTKASIANSMYSSIVLNQNE